MLPDGFTAALCASSGRFASDPVAVVHMLTAAGGWVFERKYDGVRALLDVDAGGVRVLDRAGRDVSFRYPELMAPAWPAGMVLDGEVVADDFAAAHRRGAQASAGAARALAAKHPIRFVAFDAIRVGGEDVRALPYTERSALLAQLRLPAVADRAGPTADGARLWADVLDEGGEGVVAKLATAGYPAGRSLAWVKVRRARCVSAVACGATPGSGRRAGTFGALLLALVDDGRFVEVGKVGTGFTQADLVDLDGRLRSGAVTVVDVEFFEVRSGQLRMPSFAGVRDDLGLEDCTLDQLEGLM